MIMSGLPYSNARQQIQSSVANNMNSFNSVPGSGVASSGASILGSLASGASGLLGSVASGLFNMWNQSKQRDWEEEMWNKENEYNLPENQVQRFLDAGINPAAAVNSVLGQNGSVSATAPDNPGSGNVMGDLGPLFANSANSYMERLLMQSDIDKNTSDAAKSQSEKNLIDSQNVEQQAKNKYAEESYKSALNKLVADGRISESNARILESSEYYKKEGARVEYEQQLQTLGNSKQQFKNLEQQMYHEMASTYLAMQQAGLAQAEINKVYSDIGLNNAQIEQISHNISNIDAEAASTWKDVDRKAIENGLLEIQQKYAKAAEDAFDQSGININDPLWSNVVRLCSTGKEEDFETAKKLLENNWTILEYSDVGAHYGDRNMRARQTEVAFEGVRAAGNLMIGAGVFNGKVTPVSTSVNAPRPEDYLPPIFQNK